MRKAFFSDNNPLIHLHLRHIQLQAHYFLYVLKEVPQKEPRVLSFVHRDQIDFFQLPKFFPLELDLLLNNVLMLERQVK